jgi:hypothetical protein
MRRQCRKCISANDALDDSNMVEPIYDKMICRPFLNAFGFSYDKKINTCTHKMCTHKGLTYCCECGEWGSYIDSLGGGALIKSKT